ncbi:MAG: NUDIX hydrolase [Armatimonadetes bacterium]|jgi:ADP-ribose pyrophosphatase YjhB (NUDIX family)|nr:NUDIX hydrolase [Armatimonadota bacterium]
MRREYPERPIAAVAAVILHKGKVLLVRRGTPPNKGIWTFPGGCIELGETARTACVREVLEETGIKVNVGPVVETVDVLESDGKRCRRHYTVIDFLAVPAGDAGPVCASEDAEDARWFDMAEIDNCVLVPVARRVLDRAVLLLDKEPMSIHQCDNQVEEMRFES